MHKKLLVVVISIAALSLAACGGGGGGGPSPGPMPPSNGNGDTPQLSVGQISGPSSVDEGQSATFAINALGVSGITYSWSVNPTNAGSFANATSASATFTASEVSGDTAATIQVVVSASGQTSQTRTKSVTVENVSATVLIVEQISGPSSVNEGSSASFSVSASGPSGITYSWSVSPTSAGSFTTPTSASTTFAASQVSADTIATIQVVVSASGHITQTRAKVITVLNASAANVLPEAVATASPTSGKAPLTVSLNGNASQDPDGTITRYEWDFDGNGSYDFSSYSTGLTEHVYTAQGSYLAILRVTDDDGGSDMDSVQIMVSPGNVAPIPGVIMYSYPPAWINPRYPTVWVQGAYDPDGSIVLYEWDFDGDGTYDFVTQSADPDPSSYNSVLIDINRVAVRVTDNDGATAITTERQRV